MTAGRIVVILLLVGAVALVTVKNLGPKEPVAVAVQLEPARVEAITQRVTASGKIRPEVQVKISADIGGYIRLLTVKQGDTVKLDQLLVQVDPEIYRARVKQAEAAETTARANLSLAGASLERVRGELGRVKGLFAKELASASALEKAQADFAMAQAQVEAAQGQLLQSQAVLSSARKDLEKCTIHAPMDGTVIELNKKLGERVSGGDFREDIVMTIADLSRMEVEVEVGERDVVLIHVGDPVDIEVDAYPGQKIPGTVKEVGAAGVTRNQWTESEVTNFRVVVSVGQTEHSVRPQMSATVGIRTAQSEKALTVPIQAVTMRRPSELVEPSQGEAPGGGPIGPPRFGHGPPPGGRRGDRGPGGPGGPPAGPTGGGEGLPAGLREEPVEVVFLVEDGRARPVKVKTGLSSDTRIEIREGLENGQEVVIGPYRAISKELQVGTPVRVEGGAGAGKRGPPKEKPAS